MKNAILFVFVLTISFSNLYAQTWTEQVSGVTVQLTSSSGANDFVTAWVCGYSGTVLRTTNAGANWVSVGGNGIPNTTLLISIAVIDQSTAITAGYVGSNTFVYRTSNSGANWTQVFTETGGFIDAVCINNDQPANGMMVGDPVGGRWSLWRTTNGGVNWDSSGLYLPQVGTEAGWNNAMCLRGSKIWFGTNNTKIYYTSNNGANWAAQTTGTEVNSYAVWFEEFMSSPTGLAGGASLLMSTNGGTNWSSLPSLGTGNFGGIIGGPYIITESIVPLFFYVRGNTSIYKSSNQGANWIIDYTASAGNYRYIGANRIANRFWAVRNNGGISYLDIPVGIKPNGNEIPSAFNLEQNYPNPFNPSTKINFSIPKASNVKLKIFDALGKEISVLADQFLNEGNYSFVFNAPGELSSGVYFYKLESEYYSAVKKMMLLR